MATITLVPPGQPLGRQLELDQVGLFLDQAAAGLCALVFTGAAGIGKTTMLHEGVRQAEQRGFLVLTARPSEAETRFSFAALADLLRPVDAGEFDSLPSPQRQAIDAALLRADAGSRGVERRAVSSAVLSLLERLARTRPVLLTVDDAQWLDAATTDTLAFALRRLEGKPVGVLATVRFEDARHPTFESAIPVELRQDRPLGALSAAAVHAMVKRQLEVTFSRPTLIRIMAASGGNPFYALEIARLLQRVGVPPPGSQLPVPSELGSLVRTRVARLPERTRRALLSAACLSQPSLAQLDAEAIEPAEEAGIVDVDEGGRIRFNHPLLASAVYESASRARRRAVHRELAGVVNDPEERARHLALAASRPDETVASILDAAAKQAAARGALDAAVELSRRALDLTEGTGSPRWLRRTLTLTQHLFHTGESRPEEKSVIESGLAHCTDGEVRAELLFMLGRVCAIEGEIETGHANLRAALEMTRDPELAARIHIEAAWALESDPSGALRHCDAVLQLVDADRSPAVYSNALLFKAYLQLVTGQCADEDAVERGRVLQEEVTWDDTSAVLALWPALKDDFALARTRHEERLAWSRMVGDENAAQSMVGHLAELECWTGNWARAESWAQEAQRIADRIPSTTYLSIVLYGRGYVDAHRGRIQLARAAAEAILADLGAAHVRELRARQVLGFVALSVGDPAEADRQLTRAADIVERFGHREPARFRFQADHIEAVVALGDLDRAETLLRRLGERATVFPRPWTLAMTARCRGLLLSARGELDGALASFHESLAHHENLEMPFERARTLLLAGQLLRRMKQRRAARTKLQESLATFERLGAPLWAQRARDELARVPVRQAPSELTPTEEKIAQLAASGMTNRQAAERAFVSLKTVEANLARVYRKLDIHSRAELGRVMMEREGSLIT